jgi:signal transduction histidine kinase
VTHLTTLALPVGALVVTGALANDLRVQTREDLEHQGALLALHIAERARSGPGLPLARLNLGELLRAAKRATYSGVRVVDRDGRVVASSGDGVGEDVSDDPEVAAALDGERGSAVRARPDAGRRRTVSLAGPSRHADVRVFVATPILAGSDVVGAVLLSRTPREEVQAFFQMAPRLGVGAGAALALTAGLAVAAAGILSRSLQALARASDGIARASPAALEELARARRSHVIEARELAAAMGAMRDRLVSRLRYISEFAGNVSHEFKTPVAALRGTVELLRDDDDMPTEQRVRFLENALSDLDRLNRMVGGLLSLARAEEGGERAPVDLAELAARACRGDTLEPRGVSAPVEGDAGQLLAALGNLVDNARRHGGPRVEVTTWAADGRVGVDVTDDGPGISQANLPRVIDRFFTTARGAGGTGLGLALTRAVALAHGGNVEVESAPGRTRFRLWLPARPD